MSGTEPAAVVVLAAGAGTRMRSAIPKVLHEICGRSLLGHAVVTARSVRPHVSSSSSATAAPRSPDTSS